MGSILSMQWPISSVKQTRKLPPAVLVAAGALHQMRGRLAVIRGTVLHNDILRAQGHRQQLVGMLQRFWKKDRQSVEAWVDALLRRGTPAPAAKQVWRPNAVRPILHQET
jgi:hypothetical protein